jgi:hypothetical protein
MRTRSYNERVETVASMVTANENENFEYAYIPVIRDDDVTDQVDDSKFKIEKLLPAEQQAKLRVLLS